MITSAKRTANYSYAIRDIVAAAEVLERTGRTITRLNIGDPQAFGYRPPESLTRIVAQATNSKFTGYAHSAGLPEAREAVATYVTKLGSPTSADEVLITSGASEAADLVLSALLDPGDEVLLPSPGYPLYAAILSKLGARAVYYNLSVKNNWQPCPEEITELVGIHTKAIVLINPNNPTGSVTSDKTTKGLLEIAAALNLLVISDEVYRELCFERAPSTASVLAEQIDCPVITLESLSKTHMLSGWRVGWMRFTNSERMQQLLAAIGKLASGRLCSPTPAQYAIKPALEGRNEFQQEFLSDIRRKRDFAVSRVREIDGISCSIPEAAFYLLVKADLPPLVTDERFVLELLEETGVLVVPGSGFGCRSSEGYFRLIYLAELDTLEMVFAELENFMRSRSDSVLQI